MSDWKDSGNFLNRWSARKQQAARPVANENAAQGPVTALADSPDPADSKALLPERLSQAALPGNDFKPSELTLARAVTTDDHNTRRHNENLVTVEPSPTLLTDADMPDVETLTASSDISGFLGKGVSAALRKAALRHVFRQPAYNVRDGLDDYDDDYTVFEPLGSTVTSDMKFHAARIERARLESERLAQEQVQRELAMPDSAEAVQDELTSIEKQQAGEPAEEKILVDHEAAAEADHEPPLTETSQARTSQPCEASNE